MVNMITPPALWCSGFSLPESTCLSSAFVPMESIRKPEYIDTYQHADGSVPIVLGSETMTASVTHDAGGSQPQ